MPSCIHKIRDNNADRQNVFRTKKLGQISSSSEFSQVWLGHEESYAGVLRSKRRQPSAEALAHCVTQLVLVSDRLLNSDDVDQITKGLVVRRLAQQWVSELMPAQVRGLL